MRIFKPGWAPFTGVLRKLLVSQNVVFLVRGRYTLYLQRFATDFYVGRSYGGIMSSCQGNLAATAKVDREMLEFVDSEADRLGINRAEFMRRLLELYRESRRENTDCPHCDGTVQFDLRA